MKNILSLNFCLIMKSISLRNTLNWHMIVTMSTIPHLTWSYFWMLSLDILCLSKLRVCLNLNSLNLLPESKYAIWWILSSFLIFKNCFKAHWSIIFSHHWFLVCVNKFMLSSPSISSSFCSFTFASHNFSQISFFFCFVPSLLIFSIFCLFVEKLHEWDFISNIVWIVDQYEFFLTIIKNFLITSSRCMNNEELWWLTFPRSWILRVLRFVNFQRFLSFLYCFCSFLGSCFGVVLIWVVFFDHRWTELPSSFWYIITASTFIFGRDDYWYCFIFFLWCSFWFGPLLLRI